MDIDTGMNKRILLVDLSPDKKSSLEQLLNRNFYVIKTDAGNFSGAFAESKPHLVLVRAGDDAVKKDAFIQTLTDIAAHSSVPVAVFSSVVDTDFYVKCLKSGIVHHVKSPGSKNYLVSKISGLLEKKFSLVSPDDLIDFSFFTMGQGHELSLTKEKLIAFLLSTMENSQYQTRLVQDILKKKCSVIKAGSDTEFLDTSTALSIEETVMAEELERSYKQEDFRLFFQPVINLPDGRVRGFESLLRWEHPERGMVGPDQFIPVLEKTNLIAPLGFWIVEEAARQSRKWLDEFSFNPPIQVNVNLSARQFVLEELCDRIFSIVEEYRLPPEALAFEVTESAFMEDMESANLMLLKLRANNHRIYMDDFGTGYSSLSYLQHFPVDTLKIDKSFVEWMHIDEQSELIVQAIVDLAHNLKMTVVAEGVETEEHRDRLMRMKCDFGQGYLFARPLDVPAARLFLQQMRSSGLV